MLTWAEDSPAEKAGEVQEETRKAGLTLTIELIENRLTVWASFLAPALRYLVPTSPSEDGAAK